MKKIALILVMILLLSFSVCPVCAAPEEATDGEAGKPAVESAAFSAESPYAIFMDVNTGRVMYEKNADEKVYPASTVKIMTAVLALEKCGLEERFEASQTALDAVPDGVTVMDIMPGESLTVRQLLYGAMLASAADATNVLAEAVSGTIGDFVSLMNDKAKELGMTNTNFSNTHGEHDDRTYTTVRDMAILARYAMGNPDFREIVKTDQYTVQPTEKYKEVRNLVNTNYMVSRVQRSDYYYGKAIGVKSGYTAEARSCLVEAAQDRNMELLALTFGSETVDGKAQGYIDCRNFFETAFENYKSEIVVTKGTLVGQVPVKNARRAGQVLLEASSNLYYIHPSSEELGAVTYEITTDDYVKAPVGKGDVVGKCEYFYDGVSAGVIDLVADKDYKFDVLSFITGGIVSFVTSPIFIGVIILLLIAIIYIRYKCRQRRLEKQRRLRAKRRREAEEAMRRKLDE